MFCQQVYNGRTRFKRKLDHEFAMSQKFDVCVCVRVCLEFAAMMSVDTRHWRITWRHYKRLHWLLFHFGPSSSHRHTRTDRQTDRQTDIVVIARLSFNLTLSNCNNTSCSCFTCLNISIQFKHSFLAVWTTATHCCMVHLTPSFRTTDNSNHSW